MISAVFEKNEKEIPLIHNITNYVTANDVANAELAVGGAPIMADAPEEAEEITAAADALNINLGTPNPRKLQAMFSAGKTARKRGIPIVLDLVGAGATKFRNDAARRLIAELRPSVIKGNVSEIAAVISDTHSRGVDAEAKAKIDRRVLCGFARTTGAVIAVSGAEDMITDGEEFCIIKNGSKMMSRITGAGCMLSGIVSVVCAKNTENIFGATVLAVLLSGVCAEIAEEKTGKEGGCGTFRMNLADAFSNITQKEIEERAEYEIK